MKGKIKYTIINGLCVPDTKDIMDNITGGGSGEPDKYIKQAVNAQNKILTLIDNKDNVIRFEPETSGKPEYYLVSAENKNNKELKITTNAGDSIEFTPEIPENYIESVVNTDNKTLTLTDNNGVITKFTPTGGESPLNYLASITKDSDNKTITITDNKDNETTFPYGGSGGTSDYRALENLPTINGVKILGDKYSADYDLVSASVQNPINEELTTKVAKKQDKLTAGNNIVIDENNVISTHNVIADVRYNGNSVVNEDGIANLNLNSPNGTITLTVSGETTGHKTLNVDSTFARYNTADDGLILTFSKDSDTLNIKHAKFAVGSTNYDGLYLTTLLTSGSFVVPGIFKVLSLDLSDNLVSSSLNITPIYDDYQTGIVKTRIELKENTKAIRSKVDVRSVFDLSSGYLASGKATVDNYNAIIENNTLHWNLEADLSTSLGAVGTKLLAKSLNTTFTDNDGNKWKIDYDNSPTTWTYRTGECLWGSGSGSTLVWLPLATEYKFEPSATNPLLSIYVSNTSNTTGKTSYFRCCLNVPLIKQ